MSSATKASPSGRFVVANPTEERLRRALWDCGIAEGDEILAPNGFPKRLDAANPPAVELARTLHPNVAWFLHNLGVLVPREDPTEADHA